MKIGEELEVIDEAGQLGGAEAVIDIYNGQSRAAIQHCEKRCKSRKMRAVTDAAGHSDHRNANQSVDNTRQPAFHTCNNNDYSCFCNPVLFQQEAMQTRDTNVIK